MKVAEMIRQGAWKWPVNRNCKYPKLYNTGVPSISNAQYTVMWRPSDGRLTRFSVGKVWKEIRENKAQVD